MDTMRMRIQPVVWAVVGRAHILRCVPMWYLTKCKGAWTKARGGKSWPSVPQQRVSHPAGSSTLLSFYGGQKIAGERVTVVKKKAEP